MHIGNDGTRTMTSLLPSRSTAMTSCAPQSENQRRFSNHRGDSPNARPLIRVCSSGMEDSFRRHHNLLGSAHLIRLRSGPWIRHPTYEISSQFQAASTVGMPVPRHSPYSPGRAVFPHPVLRLYSLPRCKAEPSGKHSPTWNLRNTRTRYLDAVEDVGKLLPRVA